MSGRQPDDRLRRFLVAHSLARAGEPTCWTALEGGVSSDIWRVDLPGRSLCIKRALPRLKVAQVWNAPVERNAYEWAWMRFAARHCPDNVPAPLAADAEQGIFAMRFLDPAHHPVWKRLLLDGIVSVDTAAQVARILATLHNASAGDAKLAQQFASDAIFHAIRLEPYLIATAQRHPDLAPRLAALVQRTASMRIALVHGDVSPKNILVGPRGPVFLDAECAWYGDPAFDAAFCLNHFLLKCLARRASAAAYLASFDTFADVYLRCAQWESRDALEARVASLLPGLFLARIDGKSPVEYVTNERDRDLVRATARPLVERPPARLSEVVDAWRTPLVVACATR